MVPNKYTWFLQEYGEVIAAIAWSKYQIDGSGAVTIAMFPNGNFKVGDRRRDRNNWVLCHSKIRIHR
jgi:hypothetical protein